MRLADWEETIQKMIDQCNNGQLSADKVFLEWRVKLEQKPTLLRPFEIDEIVRAVRGRLNDASPEQHR